MKLLLCRAALALVALVGLAAPAAACDAVVQVQSLAGVQLATPAVVSPFVVANAPLAIATPQVFATDVGGAIAFSGVNVLASPVVVRNVVRPQVVRQRFRVLQRPARVRVRTVFR